MKNHAIVEALESRIAPAAVFTFTDVDGDAVTVKTSKGSNADLAAVITTSTPAGSVAGGLKLDTINLAMNPVFDGTDLSVTAKPGPLGGDGLVNVARIGAIGLDLGVVKIGGDLVDFDAGKNSPASKIKGIDLQTTSGASTWNLNASVGSLKVARDLRGAEIVIGGASLGLLQLGGSLIGETVIKTGYVGVTNGTIGKVIIKGSILGGAGGESGAIVAKDILSVAIGGSMIGGSGANSGEVFASNSLGSVLIKGDLRGGAGANSGLLHSSGKLGNVTLGGSLIGGAADHAGTIEGVGGIGKVAIARDVRGGSAGETGTIQSTSGGISGVKIGGSLTGGTASNTGRIFALGGSIGPIQIGGDLSSNTSPTGALLDDSGSIFAQIGAIDDADRANITSITIGGSLRGGSSTQGGQIYADGTLGVVKIGRDVLGANGASSGKIQGFSGILSVSIGGNLIGGAGNNSGFVSSIGGPIGPVKIGGSMTGSSGDFSGAVHTFHKLGNVTVGGDLLSDARIGSNESVGAVKIGGSVVGSRISGELAAGSQLAIKSVTIGGRVEKSEIVSGSADAQFGPIKVGGDWIASNVRTGINAGADNFLGTADDTAFVGDPALFSKIASIVIGGQVSGSATNMDHFGFVSQEIGSLKINGVTVPLTKGRGNDTDVSDTRFILGNTRDVTVHEVA
jgi:hypothetical protein